MTYEEKFEKVVEKLKEERKFARKGRPSKFTFDDNSFTKISISEVCKILLQLQDEGILKVTQVLVSINDFPSDYEKVRDPENYEHAEIMTVEFGEELDKWYEQRHKDRTGTQHFALRPTFYPKNIAPTFASKSARQIADNFSEHNRPFVVKVITKINSLYEFSSDGRVPYTLQALTGQERIQERQLLKKLASFGMFNNLGEDSIYGIATLKDINIELIKDVLRRFEELSSGTMSEEEFEEITKQDKVEIAINPEKETNEDGVKNNTPPWSDDFRWEGSVFIFGDYGCTPRFTSKVKKKLFSELTKARGEWVTLKRLREVTGKDNSYLRPTIGQIEKEFSSTLKKVVSIPSTTDDNWQPRPTEGAYRIKVAQKSL